MRSHSFAGRIGALLSITAAVWTLSLDMRSAAAPSPVAADALLENQWHLKDRSKETGGANVRAAWSASLGAGVVIGIVDDGVQYAHPDLAPNYLASASWDFNSNDADPQPFSTSPHGTAVAGVAAARGDNSIGVSGVAPQASLAALRLTALTPSDTQEASAFGFQPDVIDILNNSWNPTDNGTTLKGPGTQAAAARQTAATTGRDGKGRIFVWSSGNGRLVGDDCNFDGYANSRFAIAVGASTDAAVQMPNSEGCSALMVLAPAGGGSRALTTTDLIATPGYDGSDYASGFGTATVGGMNAAAPTVSGAVALMLARNPNLTWRDVQHILRATSVRILPTDAGWTTGSLPHNERLGFGLLDADAAVDRAGTWVNVPAEQVLAPGTRNVNQPIPDINQTGISDTITISANDSNFVIEHIEVDFNVAHTWRGDLQVKLTSPSGVVSNLAPIRPNDSGDNFTNWKFGSVRHWGQTAAGVWTLNVADRRFQDVGTWNNWTLRIYGYRSTASAPGTFGKSSPGNGASGVPTNTTLSWTASSGATSYEYCYDAVNDDACVNWINNGASTNAAVSGLSNGATYFWHVRASNATGVTYAQGSATAFWSFSTGAPPGAFALSSPAHGASGQPLNPTLSWTASSGAAAYEYCYDTSNNGSCDTSWFSAGGATSVGLSGLTASTTYYWHVRALNLTGAMTYAGGSATAFRSFSTVGAPGAFSHSSPANGATGQPLTPTLMWTASSGATSYEYCYDTTNDGACSTWSSAGANTSAAIGGLAAGTTYYWQVRATNSGGTTYAEGTPSALWSFQTILPPGAFGHSSPSNGATNQGVSPTLSWSASAGAVSYEYCYDTTNNNACNANWISVGNATSVGLSGLAAGTTHYWQVRAINTVGTTYAEANASAFWSFTTSAQAGTFDLSSPANGATGLSLTPTISWEASTGATSYEYCYDTTNNNACSANWISVGNATSVGLSGLSAGTTYYWLVRANSAGGTTYANGGASAFWSFTTIAVPGAFTHSSPANGSTAQSLTPTLSWSASAGAANYDYCIDTTNDNSCTTWTGVGLSTSVGLSGLTVGTTYYWQVRAINGGGITYANGSAAAFWGFTTGVLPAAFVKSTPASGATGLSLTPTVTWASSTGATSYEYCYDTTNDSACTTWTGVGASTSAGLSGLTPGTTYYWQVRANNSTGTTYANGAATATWSFTTIAAPGAFTHISPANGATAQSLNPTLSWSGSAGAANYDYCIDTTNDNACNTWNGVGASTSVGLTGLTAGVTYYWQVRAVNGGGTTYANGALTAFWGFTTGTLPGAFVKSSPANGATGQSLTPSIDWGNSTGATSYEYCYDTTNDNACTVWTATGSNSSGALSGLTPGTTYYWQVRALNGAGATYANGSASSYWNFVTIALPGAFGHSSPANGATGQSGNPTLSWTASAGAANYDYCYDTTNDNACSEWNGAGASTSVGLTGLVGGTTYYWQVRAVNGGGTTYANGSATAYWNFKTAARPRPVVDLNGDGNGDVLTYNPATGGWARHVSLAGGGVSTTLGSWSSGWTVTPVSFNTDALTDFFLINPTSGAWSKMINNGTGFTQQATGTWWPGWQRFIMDFDGDGDSDIFLYDPAAGQWFKSISTPMGFNYVQGAWNPGWEIYPMALNTDAFGDMFLIDRSTGRWFWVLGQADGSFTYPQVGYWAADWTLYPGDFNGDGRGDWFLYRPDAGEYYVATNNGAGYSYVAGYGWASGWKLTVADLNADGLADLFLYNKTNGRWFELQGNGAGQFATVGQGSWTPGWDLYPSDFNEDGRADLLLYKPTTGEWFQAINTTMGSFTYFGGQWQAGLSISADPTIR